MAITSTLYLSASQAILLREHRGRLSVSGVVDRAGGDERANADLKALLQRFPKDRVNAVVDVVEEELVVESMPMLRQRDLGALVARRLEHRRDRRLLSWSTPRRSLSLASLARLKRDGAARLPVRIGLLASDSPSQAWLQAAIEAGAHIDRVTSPGLLSAEVGSRIGRGHDGLLVTVGPAGIRQTLVVDGIARFTRLAQLFDLAPRIDPILAECARTLQYLLMNQAVPRDAIAKGRLRLWLVVDGIVDDRPPAPTLVVDSASSIRIHPLLASDLGAPRSAAALPMMLGAVPLWCDRRLPASLSRGYESVEARRPLTTARTRHAILTGSVGLTAAAAMAVAAVEVMTQIDASQAASTVNAMQRAAEERLSQAIAAFPLGGPDMRRLVDADRLLQDRRLALDTVMTPVASAVQSSPAIRIERIRWQRPGAFAGSAAGATAGAMVSGGPGTDLGVPAMPDASTDPLSAGLVNAGPPTDAPPAGSVVDLVIDGGVRLPASKQDANRSAEEFAASIAAACGCEVVVTTPPYDPNTTTAFSSLVDGERHARAATPTATGARAESYAEFSVRMRQPTPPPKEVVRGG